MSSMAGELVTETCEHDGGPQVTVYVPRDRPEAVVFAGDRQLCPRHPSHLMGAVQYQRGEE